MSLCRIWHKFHDPPRALNRLLQLVAVQLRYRQLQPPSGIVGRYLYCLLQEYFCISVLLVLCGDSGHMAHRLHMIWISAQDPAINIFCLSTLPITFQLACARHFFWKLYSRSTRAILWS